MLISQLQAKNLLHKRTGRNKAVCAGHVAAMEKEKDGARDKVRRADVEAKIAELNAPIQKRTVRGLSERHRKAAMEAR